MMRKQVLGSELWAPNIIKSLKSKGISMIFIFANAWFFDKIFHLYEFQEKQNIAYQLGRRSKSEDFHDDFRGFQRQNIEYYLGDRATVDFFHVIQGVRV